MSRLRVMVIDDSALVLSIVDSFLSSVGHEVIPREMAVGTRAAVLRERPDVVLLDINMPLLNGDEVCEAIRSHELIGATRILLHSDRPEPEVRELSKRCGADGYLCKTSDRETFLKRFVALTASRSSEALFVGGDATWERLPATLKSEFGLTNAGTGLALLRRLARESPDFLLIGTSVADVSWRTLWENTLERNADLSSRTIVVAEDDTETPESAASWRASDPLEQLTAQIRRIARVR